MTFFGALTFAEPWILLGLIVLPAIWFLLRVTPPSPKRVVFPPLRLLLGLNATEETPARTPWWLLLLRMIAAALIVVALAQPTIGQPPKPLGSGPLVLFVDNGWTAAAHWDASTPGLPLFREMIGQAVERFAADVRSRRFPGEAETYFGKS